MTKYAEFGDNTSEREVLEVASSAGIINDDVFKVCKNLLNRGTPQRILLLFASW
jgi:hypothetical protein